MAHYDAYLDQIITGSQGQTRENLMRVLTDQNVPFTPPTDENPTGEFSKGLSLEAFHNLPMWGQKSQVPRANQILDGASDMGALILTHVTAGDYLDLWQTATILQPGGDPLIDGTWQDIAPDEDRVDEWKDELLQRHEGNAVPIPTPVLQISSLGDLVTVPNGLARAAAVYDINDSAEPNPAHMKGDLMPLYVLARPVGGSRFDDFPSL